MTSKQLRPSVGPARVRPFAARCWSAKLLALVLGGLLQLSCGSRAAGGDEGSESHWLSRCATDADCAAGQCLCNVCTKQCRNVTECPAPLDLCVTEVGTAPLLENCSSEPFRSPATPGLCGVSDPSLLSGKPKPLPVADEPEDPGQPVKVSVPGKELSTLEARIAEMKAWDADELLTAYPVEFETKLNFDPKEAINYELIQASRLALSPAEEDLYAQNGFVITSPVRFATFTYGYHNIYGEDLPVYITADSVLDAVHRSYDDILKELELEVLVPTFERYLAELRAQLSASNLPTQVRKDADLFLAVSQSLLTGKTESPAFEGSFTAGELDEFIKSALDPKEPLRKTLFGVKRDIDFTQFTPRGHYTDSEELSRYFRAMMWMGRIDFRMLETKSDGEQVFHRRQVEAVLGLYQLMTPELRADWELIDRTVTAFVGEHDYMHVGQISALLNDLEVATLAELTAIEDARIAQTLVSGNYGEQRIHSHLISKSDVFGPTLPLNVSFALFGQRYVLDSHVFSQVVYDRVPDRAVPNPLDAAFAALGNNHAALLLKPELEAMTFAGNLGAMRELADSQPAQNWESSLYTLWEGALRELSAGKAPAGTVSAAAANVISEQGSGLPGVTKTEAWGRRLLNTQLGSWSQLRHDTLLYAKQSYTVGSVCEFPDAYVDPYPAFWAKLLRFAERGSLLVTELGLEDSATIQRAADYFQRFSSIVSVLHNMSLHQLSGEAHSPEDVAFVNNVVRISGGGSGAPTVDGWFHQLMFHPEDFHEVDNIIADVHTDPGGDIPQRGSSVLHVGTGYPRLMIVAVETCAGPRAYAGPVFDYKEHLQPGLVRLNDEDWQSLLNTSPPAEVPWMTPIVSPAAP